MTIKEFQYILQTYTSVISSCSLISPRKYTIVCSFISAFHLNPCKSTEARNTMVHVAYSQASLWLPNDTGSVGLDSTVPHLYVFGRRGGKNNIWCYHQIYKTTEVKLLVCSIVSARNLVVSLDWNNVAKDPRRYLHSFIDVCALTAVHSVSLILSWSLRHRHYSDGRLWGCLR